MFTEVDHHDVSEVVQAHRKFRWEFVAAFLGLRKQSGRSKRLKSKCQTQLQRPSHFDTKSSCSRVLMPLALVDRADDRGADVPECSSMPCGLETRYERTTSSRSGRGGSSADLPQTNFCIGQISTPWPCCQKTRPAAVCPVSCADGKDTQHISASIRTAFSTAGPVSINSFVMSRLGLGGNAGRLMNLRTRLYPSQGVSP